MWLCRCRRLIHTDRLAPQDGGSILTFIVSDITIIPVLSIDNPPIIDHFFLFSTMGGYMCLFVPSFLCRGRMRVFIHSLLLFFAVDACMYSFIHSFLLFFAVDACVHFFIHYFFSLPWTHACIHFFSLLWTHACIHSFITSFLCRGHPHVFTGRNTESFDPRSTLVRPEMRVRVGPNSSRYTSACTSCI